MLPERSRTSGGHLSTLDRRKQDLETDVSGLRADIDTINEYLSTLRYQSSQAPETETISASPRVSSSESQIRKGGFRQQIDHEVQRRLAEIAESKRSWEEKLAGVVRRHEYRCQELEETSHKVTSYHHRVSQCARKCRQLRRELDELEQLEKEFLAKVQTKDK